MVSGAYVSLTILLVLNLYSKNSSKHDLLEENSQIWHHITYKLAIFSGIRACTFGIPHKDLTTTKRVA